MCRALEVTRQGYYAFLNPPPKKRPKKTREQLWHEDMERIRAAEKEKAKQERIKNAQTVAYEGAEDLLPERVEPHQVWVGDVLSVFARGIWSHIAVVFELAETRALDWAVAVDEPPVNLGTDAWNAARSKTDTKPAIFHSDPAGHFARGPFRAVLRKDDVKRSASALSSPRLSFVETQFSTLRSRVQMGDWTDAESLQSLVFEYFAAADAKKEKRRAVLARTSRPNRGGKKKRKPKGKKRRRR
ncbi:MAG: hypothetical protein AAGE52_38890 [Myxococcota bacterium]